MAEAVYLLCAMTSIMCATVLLRSYRRSPLRLILFTSLSFVGFALNNVLLFIDLAIIPEGIDLMLLRIVTGLVAVSLLLYGLMTTEL